MPRAPTTYRDLFPGKQRVVFYAVSLWEAHKVTLRGHIIQLASTRKGSREQKIQDLSAQLAETEAAWKSKSSASTKKVGDSIAAELDLLATEQAEKGLAVVQTQVFFLH